MSRRLSFALSALALLIAVACTSGDATSTPSPTAQPLTPTASPSPEATTRAPLILPTATPSPDLVELAATVWLVDVAAEVVTTIVEDFENSPYDADFTDDGNVRIRYWLNGPTDYTYALDGAPVAEAIPVLACHGTDDGAEIDGRIYPGTYCGPISPDGAFMTYAIDAGDVEVDGRYSVPSWDQWVVELDGGDRRLLQDGLRHCGGCDWFFGPEWSSSGRFLVFPEILDGGLVYLADMRSEATTIISDVPRPTGRDQRPVWSSNADRLLRPGPDGSTILEDFDAGSSDQLDELPWPAAFDPTGTYIYSPGWAVSTQLGPHQRTTVADASTGEVVGKRVGTPSGEYIWDVGGDPIVAVDDNFVAALENSADCVSGTLVYDPGLPAATCVEDAIAAVFSPDTSLVAFARRSGRTGPSSGPGLESFDGIPTFEIVIFNRATKEITVVAEGAVGYQFPDLTWNGAGTHLLIRWPNRFGL